MTQANWFFELERVQKSLIPWMTTENLSRLDGALNELTDPAESQCELLREHLEAARITLLGEMQEEYALNLRLASNALNCIADVKRRNRLKKLLDDLQSAKA